MSDVAVIAGRKPLPVDVEAGKDYYWCACGKSAKQPFCDGSHKGGSFTPLKWTASETKTAYFCTCKQTATPPLCNGAHKTLPA
ncbi:MAG: CDGSH iron-sulfur domain-containing protein [Xanthobacteraceae bacterium]